MLRTAFEASPRETLAALAQLARGKRLRAWNMLCVSATRSPHYYSLWITAAEPAAIARWSDQAGSLARPANLLGLVLADEDTPAHAIETTEADLRRAFGGGVTVSTVRTGHDAQAADWDEATAWEWLLPIPAGDRLSPTLGDAIAAARLRQPQARLIYWNEDRISHGQRHDPWIKPGWDRLLFERFGGLVGAALLNRSILQCDTSPRSLVDGASLARLGDAVGPAAVCHVPLILTHRQSPAAQPSPLADPVRESWPAVSVIIPIRDKPQLLRDCLKGLDQVDYPGTIETIVVDNGSIDPEALCLLETIEQSGTARVIKMPGPFNYSRLNNAAVQVARGELLCLLNNDIEPLDGMWLTRLVAHAAERDVGAVGAQLLYPDGTIQHAGVAIGMGRAAGHIQRGITPGSTQHWHWAFATRQVSAVTGACLVVARDKYLEVGGLDEDAFAVAFNDVDLCLKLDRAGYRNIYVAEARLIHHESKSRGLDDVPEKAERFRREMHQLQLRWNTIDARDPHFTEAFSLASEQCVLPL